MRRLLLLAALLFSVGAGIATAQEDVFAPFPSRFRVAVRDPEVRLTWRDASADVGGYRVYRHTDEITAETFTDATLVATVAEGVESYLDTPPPGRYHYAVVAESGEGRAFEVFIPFRNKTTEAVRIAEGTAPESGTPQVQSIETRAEEERIMISFEATPEEEAYVLFRSTQPLDSTDALAGATRIGPVGPGDTPVSDYPVPGVSYYYGVFTQGELEEGTPRFEPGVTVTSDAVEIPLTATRVTLPPFDASPRSRNPLPFLRLNRELEDGEEPLPRNPVSMSPKLPIAAETEAAVGAILETLPEPTPEKAAPHVLPEDRNPGEKGPGYTLSQIATGAFSAERWEEVEPLLENLLSATLPQAVEARAHFYLAQTYYFTDRSRLAFLEFLMARKTYYVETSRWMDRILRELDR